MKYILCIAFLFGYAYGQEKKDNRIKVNVNDTTGLFNKIALVLYERGYNLTGKDEALKVISTDEKSLGSASAKFRLMIKDSTIILSGDLASNVSISIGGAKIERTFSPISYGGMKGSDLRIAWNEMVAIAKQFGDHLVFFKQ